MKSFHINKFLEVLKIWYNNTLVFPGGASSKDPAANAGDARDAGSIPGRGRSSGGGRGNPLQDSCLGNTMDSGAWRTRVHGVANSLTRLK